MHGSIVLFGHALTRRGSSRRSRRIGSYAAVAGLAVWLGCSSSEEDVQPAAPAGATSTGAGAAGASSSSASSGGGGDATAAGATSSASTGGAGGSGGSGAAGGGGGAAGGWGGAGGSGGGSAGAGGGGGLGSGCTAGDPCGPGLFCKAPGCGMGSCEIVPSPAAEQDRKDPVCGCDGATYWNESIADQHGASVAHAGPCMGQRRIACGPGMPCPAGLHCRMFVADAAACSNAVTGTCWGVPFTCGLEGPKARACTDQTCQLECSLVQSDNPWFDDGSCP